MSNLIYKFRHMSAQHAPPRPAPKPGRQRLLLAAVFAGLFLAMLDQTVVGTALPEIATQLGGTSGYAWVVTAYLVTATVSLPVYARLSDRHGRRHLLLVGMALFAAGSVLCAIAGSMAWLIAARALQGLGAGALEGLTFILVADLYRGRRSAALQGALAGLMGVAFLLGPLIGGALTDHIGWRSIFLVNVPVALIAFVIVARVLPASIGRSEEQGAPLDVLGIALLTTAVTLVLVGLSAAAPDGAVTGGAWVRWDTGGLLVTGLVLAAVLVRVERRAAAPILPPALFTERRTAALLVAGATVTFGLYASVLLLPRYFQSTQGIDATASGLLMYPLLLGLLASVNVGAMVIARTGALRTVLLCGCALTGAGALGFATFGRTSPDWHALVFMGLLGVGMGPALSGVQIALQRALPPARVAGAIGTLLLLRQLGGSLALVAANAVYAWHAPGAGEAAATGTGVLVVSGLGALLTVGALLNLRGEARRIAVLPAPVRAAD